ncbi:MAG: 23S rRNA (uracil(1939)-C(5))-methyltransferase RlmD [Desulfuromonadaceae bacterium]|nr:23S rRNA (uracil(1939)-C(5))-methyltransferase RlmD [Desulfuromonadaceae bacterium]
MKPPKKSIKPAPDTVPRPPRKSVDTVEFTIDRLNVEGIGVARDGHREVLIAGALPGERVLVHIVHRGQRRIIADLRRILTPSRERIPSPCKVARKCLGCPLIALHSRAQRRFKFDRVRNALIAMPTLESISVQPVLDAPAALGYRTQAKLAIGGNRRDVRIGLYRRGSHDIVDIDNCPLHHPLINRIVAVVREEIIKQKVLVYDPRRKRGLLRYVAIRVSPTNNKALVTFVTTERNYNEMTALAKWLKRKIPEVVGVHENVNMSDGNVIFGRVTFKLLGVDDLFDRVGAVQLSLSPTAFFQVNHDQATHLYQLVQKWAEPTASDTVLDLYCGIGGIALHLAAVAGQVIGIESNEEAILNARRNAVLNNLKNCVFYAGMAEDLLEEMAAELPLRPIVVVNPPRSGCAESVLQAIISLRPKKLIYVSCNPDTLAHDLDILVKAGLKPITAQPVDMFPQTPHVETVVLLAGA